MWFVHVIEKGSLRAMSGYWIQVVEPGHSPRVVTLVGDVEVGRDCDGIVIEDPTASRRHLRLEPSVAGLIVEDLNSANGTYIDEERIVEPMIVQAGNVVRLGETNLVVHQSHATEQREAADSVPAVTGGERISSEARKLTQASQKLHRPGQSGRPPADKPNAVRLPVERPPIDEPGPG